MKTKLVLGAVAAAIAVFTQGALAQSASSPSRADVKAEAKKNKTPAGEATGSVTPPKTSDTTKEARKAQTKADQKAGKIPEAGESAQQEQDKAARAQPTTTDRTARKAETKEAVKTGKTTPAGEGPDAPKK